MYFCLQIICILSSLIYNIYIAFIIQLVLMNLNLTLLFWGGVLLSFKFFSWNKEYRLFQGVQWLPKVHLEKVIHQTTQEIQSILLQEDPQELQTQSSLWAALVCRLTTATQHTTLGESAREKNEFSTQKWGWEEPELFFKWVLEEKLEGGVSRLKLSF